ncbi:FecR family protein [Sinomicrobium sp. M5D2P17]
MEEKAFRKLLGKSLKGTLTDEEKRKLQEFEKRLLSENQDAVFKNKAHKEDIRIDVQRRIARKLRHTTRRYQWLKVAASVALLVGLSVFGYFRWYTTSADRFRTIALETGMPPEKVILPDSSVVWMNSGTTLRYDKEFSKRRKIILAGEAFFEVKKDSLHPFSVAFGDNRLEVTGTQFNIKYYKDEPSDHNVGIKEGSVHVRTAEETVSLERDDHLKFTGQGRIIKTTRPFPDNGYWNDGAMYFDRTPLNNALLAIARRYNLVLQYKEMPVPVREQDSKVTASYKTGTDIQDILKGLTLITPYAYDLDTEKHLLQVRPK